MTGNIRDVKAIQTPAEFQTAVAETKFGRYNVILLILCFAPALTIQFESSIASYIVPVATCDLNLDATQKSILNSMPFFGMITSGFLCGFLLDTLGRKKILFVGFTIQFFVVLGKSLSSNLFLLSLLSYFAGAVSGSTYVALTTYALEFHSTEYRGRVQMISGMMYSLSNICLPLLASIVLPLNFTIRLLFFDFHAWNLLILVSALSSLISAITFYFLPETPKFLMSIGKNEEALEIFRAIYKINTKDAKENYPIKSLISEMQDVEESAASTKTWKQYFKAGGQQLRPLFSKKYRLKLLLVCTVQSMFITGLNTLRLYLPQIFQAIHEFKVAHNENKSNICNILGVLRSPNDEEELELTCTVNLENNLQVYFNSAIIATGMLISYVIAGTIINLFGKRRLFGILGILASISAGCLYFSPNTATILALSSLYLACTGICVDIFMTVIVVIFPTTLRAMALTICLNTGRALTVLGNMVLPILVEVGCAPPFIFLGCLVILAVTMSLIIPDTDNEDMK